MVGDRFGRARDDEVAAFGAEEDLVCSSGFSRLPFRLKAVLQASVPQRAIRLECDEAATWSAAPGIFRSRGRVAAAAPPAGTGVEIPARLEFLRGRLRQRRPYRGQHPRELKLATPRRLRQGWRSYGRAPWSP